MKNLAAVVLAAGKGKRMHSDLPKVLHEILGRPIIEHLLDTLISLEIMNIVVVIGHEAEMVKERLSAYADKVSFVLQVEQLGTGHAVLVTEDRLQEFSGDILVVAGDVPFLSAETIEELVSTHRQEKAAATVLSSIPPDPKGYGRVIRVAGTNQVDRIVEHKDADESDLAVGEINTGTFCFDSRYLFDALKRIRSDNSQKEYYLTDIMAILRRDGLKAAVCLTDNAKQAMGINSVEQMAELEALFADKKSES